MAEPNEVSPEPGIDPEEFFNEGYSSGIETGSDAAREELYDQLESEGFDEDEIEDLLFSDDDTDVYRPRRRGGRRGGRRRRHRMSKRYDPAPRRRRSRKGRKSGARRYDPAPRNGYRRYGKRAKGMLAKLKPMVMPGAAGLTFYSAYTTRAKELFASMLITKDSVYEAIMYDLKNFDANAAIDRLQANASGIATPIVVGMVAKWAKGYVDPKLRGPIDIVGDALIGVGVGTGFKKLLDPPIAGQTQTQAQPRRIQGAQVQRVNRLPAPSAQVMPFATAPCPGCTPTDTSTSGAAWRV